MLHLIVKPPDTIIVLVNVEPLVFQDDTFHKVPLLMFSMQWTHPT